MTHVFEVAKLGEGEGFDELVLPHGHGDVVKSMIRQHLRERRMSGMNRDRTDVVRGKGTITIFIATPWANASSREGADHAITWCPWRGQDLHRRLVISTLIFSKIRQILVN